MTAPPTGYHFDNPGRTLELLTQLQAIGFTDAAFAKIHHFTQPETIERHRRYCQDLVEKGGRFRTNTNRLVQRRLQLILDLGRAGRFSNRTPPLFELLAQVALYEHPHDNRSETMNEQQDEEVFNLDSVNPDWPKRTPDRISDTEEGKRKLIRSSKSPKKEGPEETEGREGL